MVFTWLPIKCLARQPARMGKIYLYYKGGKGVQAEGRAEWEV